MDLRVETGVVPLWRAEGMRAREKSVVHVTALRQNDGYPARAAFRRVFSKTAKTAKTANISRGIRLISISARLLPQSDQRKLLTPGQCLDRGLALEGRTPTGLGLPPNQLGGPAAPRIT